jgi:hypothetical protein
MSVDPVKVMLSTTAAQSLASSSPDDFDRLLDVIAEYAEREGGTRETCVGIRDFAVGLRRGPESLEVHWIQSLRAQGVAYAANDGATPSQEVDALAS